MRSVFEAKVILLAKANQRQREQEASASTSLNLNNKRPLRVTPASSNSPTVPNDASGKPLKRDSRLGKYFDYDLSKMVNSKGGFLLEDGQEIDDTVRRKEKERERQRAMKNLEPRKSLALCSHILGLPHIYCSYVPGPGS